MATVDLVTYGYASQTIAFSVVAILLFLRRRRDPLNRWIVLGCLMSALSGLAWTTQTLDLALAGLPIVVFEVAKYIGWIILLLLALRSLSGLRRTEYAHIRYLFLVLGGALLTIYSLLNLDSVELSLTISASIIMAFVLIYLAENVYTSIPAYSLSDMKLICVALFVMAGYDTVLFLWSLSVEGVGSDLWIARGYVNALIAISVAVTGSHDVSELATDMPRQKTARPLSPWLGGIFVLLWILCDYYVANFGASWTDAATIVLVAAGMLAVAIALLSTTVRRLIRVYFTKIFFRYKYDYRKEWLRFIGILSESGLENVPQTAVRAVAPIVNSPGGIVWTQEGDGDAYLPVGAWRCELPISRTISPDSSVIRFLSERQWVIDLNELTTHPERYAYLQLDSWLAEGDEFWLIVPLLIGQQLIGLIVLLKPNSMPSLDFEDHDLLRTVGRHVATHIRQAESDRRLAESSQFGTYHRLSAFLMHDMNNLIAQQSLVVENAEKFRHDPKFVDDTIDTIAASVARMRRVMEKLSRDSNAPVTKKVSVHGVIKRAVRRSGPRTPVPTLNLAESDLFVQADPERLAMMLEHLIRNAQDATEHGDTIEIVTRIAANNMVAITITDTGSGMSPEFVSERLFRPFDSTKGSQSMGIGAYQAREYTRMLGGYVEVRSELGRGTEFVLKLPIATEEAGGSPR